MDRLTRWSALMALVLGMAITTGSAQAAGDPVAGEGKSTACQACHGADGNGAPNAPPPMPPKLAGQYSSYLERALKDYRSGDRQSPIMNGFAATLSDEDIEDLAAFYASKDSQLTDMAGR